MPPSVRRTPRAARCATPPAAGSRTAERRPRPAHRGNHSPSGSAAPVAGLRLKQRPGAGVGAEVQERHRLDHDCRAARVVEPVVGTIGGRPRAAPGGEDRLRWRREVDRASSPAPRPTRSPSTIRRYSAPNRDRVSAANLSELLQRPAAGARRRRSRGRAPSSSVPDHRRLPGPTARWSSGRGPRPKLLEVSRSDPQNPASTSAAPDPERPRRRPGRPGAHRSPGRRPAERAGCWLA